MSERPTPEYDTVPSEFALRQRHKTTDAGNDTQSELAAWELLREALRERDNLQEIIRGEWPAVIADELICKAKEAAK